MVEPVAGPPSAPAAAGRVGRARARRWALAAGEGIWLIGLTVFILGPLAVLFVFAFAKAWYYPSLLPQSWTLHWWTVDLQESGIGQAIVYSFELAPVVTVATAFLCLPTAYALARLEYPGRRAVLVAILAINSFPKMGLYISLAGFFYALNLIGTFPGVVVVQMLGTVVSMVWIPAAAFAAVPRELEEASRDVGAGPVRTFFRVTLVQALPGIIVALILTFLGSLDDAQGTYLVGAPKYTTMPVIMYSLVNGYPEQAAAVFSILLTLPSLLLLLSIRRYVFGDTFAKAFRLY